MLNIINSHLFLDWFFHHPLPEVHSDVFSWTHHSESLPCSSLPIGNYTDVVAIGTRCDGGAGVFKHLIVRETPDSVLDYTSNHSEEYLLLKHCLA